MKKIVCSLGVLSALVSGQVLADWEVGVGYHHLSENVSAFGGIPFGPELDVMTLSVSYDFEVANDLFVAPEVTLGRGITDDKQIYTDFAFPSEGVDGNIESITSEVDRFLQLGVRLEHRFGTGMYAFAMPSIANVQTETSLH